MKMEVTMSGDVASAPTLCPISRSEVEVGDRWTVLVLRELFAGSHRFEEIQAQTGATPQMVTTRLKALASNGLVDKRLYSERPRRYEYRLTPKGEAFYPVILALRAWGETWCKSAEEGRAVNHTHVPCGGPAGLGPGCQTCGASLERADLLVELSPAYQAEREARWEAFKAGR
jgi:DNA-binding HxlR family transcriptional regulator